MRISTMKAKTYMKITTMDMVMNMENMVNMEVSMMHQLRLVKRKSKMVLMRDQVAMKKIFQVLKKTQKWQLQSKHQWQVNLKLLRKLNLLLILKWLICLLKCSAPSSLKLKLKVHFLQTLKILTNQFSL